MNSRNIYEILPHREPFLFVDKILNYEPETKMVLCQKNFAFNEPFFQGHFPNAPVVPGVLIAEGMAQSAAIQYALEKNLFLGVSFLKDPDFKKVFLLSSFRSLRFKHPVCPGDVVTYRVFQEKIKGNFSWYKGVSYLNQDETKICCEGELTAFFNQDS
jgi:3-hydroxyacyl-[acyl-carrier-protein] dehydratase